jgi:hypothetical protein
MVRQVEGDIASTIGIESCILDIYAEVLKRDLKVSLVE